MDLSVLEVLEREKVLEVLQRDKILRSLEEERIRKMKLELQEIRRKGAKSFSRQYSERTCARCQRPLGKFWNCGAVCHGCSHRICNKCRINVTAQEWKCTVCHAYREVKIKSGEWFLEERAKKFSADADRHETTGEKLLKSYQRLSTISIVPPTPPPFTEGPSSGRSGGLHSSRPFTKSMENLFVSLTTHIKKISKSQDDVTADPGLLTADYGGIPSKERRSQSDTAINRPFSMTKAPSLPDLFKRAKSDNEEVQRMAEFCTDEDISPGADYHQEKRGSISSVCTELGIFDHNSSVTGEIELALVYNSTASCLEITVNGCKNLAYGDEKRKKCHPYVKIYLLPDKSPHRKLKTTVKKNTTDPVFNETLRYNIELPLLASRTLQASVWHSATLRKKVFLGEVLIPLHEWKFKDNSTQSPTWYLLCPKPGITEGYPGEQYNGTLLIKAKFTPPSQLSTVANPQREEVCMGQLSILVTGVTNLTVSKYSGTLNSFVKGCLSLPGGRELTQRTLPQRRKSNSQWNHQLVFSEVPEANLPGCCLDLELWDHASFSLAHRSLGGAKLEGASSWQQLLQTPNTWYDFTLPMQASASMKKT
ncbi:hypothetical protein MATL_G00202340 [Megalops atlanticus]|uniref:Synaptotagmin-like protein 3 n=1 Tax=Megalops atlanticus TaxID=7932 RepID=A0A9D3PJK5_MEGAT|nr:hypothetical protein MATL_G00202340 [Megalops atlanticus]